MNSEFNIQDASIPGAPIEPLEPGGPDVMPGPAPVPVDEPSREGEQPLDPDGGVLEEDMGDVDVANSVSQESPA